MNRSPLRSLLASLLVACSLVLPAGATWSIVAVNARTGEVAVATATCLLGFNMREGVPVIVVGKGAAAAQSLIDLSAVNRTIVYNALAAGQTPAQALNLVSNENSFQSRQYGICSLSGPPVTFTGNRAGAAATGVSGVAGDYVYAIQGNVLTDDAVVFAAEAAFAGTNGDMGQRLMAAMHAAKALGGDGRCSCSQSQPTSCGAPPPNFTKSAHIACMIVSRMGDEDKPCNATKGCARGDYYMTLNVAGTTPSSIDPVDELQMRYDNWRNVKLQRPDAILSTVESVDSLPADGVTRRTVTVRLANIDGVFFTTGGATIDVQPLDGLPSLTSVGPVVDNGDGSYAFTLTAGTEVGTDTFVVTADNGGQKVTTLYPYLAVRSDPVEGLHAGYDAVSASAPVRVPLVANIARAAGARYLLLAGVNGTQPGSFFRETLVPLNPPLVSVVRAMDGPSFVGGAGELDPTGRAEMSLAVGPNRLAALVGQRVDFSLVVERGDGLVSTEPVGFDVLP